MNGSGSNFVRSSGRGRIDIADTRFNVYEVSPTIPGPKDEQRDKEVSEAIEKWKNSNSNCEKLRQ
ncbi:hypothetical protein SAMN04487969_116100 [Paenibacillus algorifonticola]|uniref:Uncharacterized protein n=1 Tax=Paenibacillus algorifonticola TaxID=684063 RepID=A0A1I2GKJ0_9BACL|nr:hypothetical protein [Paenibacillus algorifonticola]SFF17347.1 hypothetical protein SAMN04487969_116100 [Paenibacillus algorifonticola]